MLNRKIKILIVDDSPLFRKMLQDNLNKIDDFEDLEAWEILELIGKKRGMMIRGGEIDTMRASVAVLDEYRGGKLGRLTLEWVK